MPTPPDPQRENSSTYFVQDRSQQGELNRLLLQDQMVTTSMGGVFPEQLDITRFQRVLDIGCGTGGWLIEAAKTCPTIKLLIGIDISGKMVEYARAEVETQQLISRVEFHVMDALRPLAFPSDFFDLVNQRLGISYLRTWDWHTLLQEYQRVSRPGGIIRITEAEPIAVSNSEALTHLCALLLQALHQAGHLFTAEGGGLTSHLANMMNRYGLDNVQAHAYPLQYSAGTEAGQHFFENERAFFRSIIPFLRKWTHVPDDYEDIYQQAVQEMQEPGFVATWNLLTVWGTNPLKEKMFSPT
jgi:ubiquinone/menaquinone biosynthesis C-methylase UbiE